MTTLNPYIVPGIPEKVGILERVKKVVCSYFETNLEDMVKNRKDRHPEYLRPRQFIIYFLVKQGYTFRQAGSVFCQGSSNAYKAYLNIDNWIKTDKEIEQQYDDMLNLIEE